MNDSRICPNCQTDVPADAPEGICPACALRAGFDLGEGSQATTRPTRNQDRPEVSVEELAHHLPELEQFSLLGQGGMGTVYKARHRKLDRWVAVKVLDPGLSENPSFAERFTREARTMAQLDHPNVVRVYDFGNRGPLSYLIMELVDGVNLRQTIQAGGLEPEEALRMVPHVCKALQYAHDQGVIHRDIKPENILVGRNGAIKIADFGLARLLSDTSGQRLTQTNQVMGTPHYMAPEQIENPATVDHRADIFALGVVLYELLTGELPVGRFPVPSKKVEIDVRLDDVVLRTLENEPALRYQQASDLRTDVESLSQESRTSSGRTAGDDSNPLGWLTKDYEYRSPETFLGLPLVHIVSSRDPKGKRMRVACGIIAIGDVAVGGIAIGGASIGLISLGGISIGIISFGGVALGLLTALGGVACGSLATGGVAFGLIARGALPISLLTLPEVQIARATLLAWAILTLGFTAAAVSGVSAWVMAAEKRPEKKD
jgi:serine/threonine protein kinase